MAPDTKKLIIAIEHILIVAGAIIQYYVVSVLGLIDIGTAAAIAMAFFGILGHVLRDKDTYVNLKRPDLYTNYDKAYEAEIKKKQGLPTASDLESERRIEIASKFRADLGAEKRIYHSSIISLIIGCAVLGASLYFLLIMITTSLSESILVAYAVVDIILWLICFYVLNGAFAGLYRLSKMQEIVIDGVENQNIHPDFIGVICDHWTSLRNKVL